MPRAHRPRARTPRPRRPSPRCLAARSPSSSSRSRLGPVVGELLEEPGRRGHGQRARRDVDLGHDRGHERHHDLATLRLHDQQVLRGQVVDVGDLADLHAVAHDVEAHELVVVPGVGLGRLLVDVLDPEDGLHEALRGGAIVDAVEEPDRMPVVPAQLAEDEVLAVPRRRLGHLQRELGARHETALGIVGVELELDGALQAVRLDEAADPELCSGCVGHVSRRCRRRRHARGGRRRAR